MERLTVLAAIVVAVVIFTAVARTILHRRHAIRLIDPADLRGAGTGAADNDPAGRDGRRVVVFTSPYCHGCREWLSALETEGAIPIALDVVARPELAARYRINVTPRVVVVRAGNGDVLGEWDHYTPRAHDIEKVARLLDIR